MRLAVCGLWVDGLYSDLRPAVWPRRGCARLDGARRQRNERGPDRAPATGPMASCASIDIEDATQHLRDILKLDRPAGGETGQGVGPRRAGRGAAHARISLRARRSLCTGSASSELARADEGQSGKCLSVLAEGRRPPGVIPPHPGVGPFCLVLQRLG